MLPAPARTTESTRASLVVLSTKPGRAWEIGVQLLDRSGKAVRATDAGAT